MNSEIGTAEKVLVKRAKNGNNEAFIKLYEHIYKDLYRLAFYMTGNKHDAEDAVSEAVISAYENIHTLRKTSSFKSWIFQITCNKCKTMLIKSAKMSVPGPERINDSLDCDNNTNRYDLSDSIDLRHAFQKLTVEERTIISLSVFGGYSSKDIGYYLRLNDNTVRSKLSRGLKKMDVMLNNDKEERS